MGHRTLAGLAVARRVYRDPIRLLVNHRNGVVKTRLGDSFSSGRESKSKSSRGSAPWRRFVIVCSRGQTRATGSSKSNPQLAGAETDRPGGSQSVQGSERTSSIIRSRCRVSDPTSGWAAESAAKKSYASYQSPSFASRCPRSAAADPWTAFRRESDSGTTRIAPPETGLRDGRSGSMSSVTNQRYSRSD